MSTQVLNLLFSMATTQFNLPPGMLNSVCFVESSYRVNVVHHDDGYGDSLGVCQIKLNTARWMGFKGTEKELMEPNNNIYYAAKYLDHLRKKYHNDNIEALIAYNQGSIEATATAYIIMSGRITPITYHYMLTRTSYSDKVMKRWRLNGYKPPAPVQRTCGRYKSCPADRHQARPRKARHESSELNGTP